MLSHFFQAHAIAVCILGYWIFSAVIGGMPPPSPADTRAYHWTFKSLHILAGDVGTAFTNRFPVFAVPDGAAAVHKETMVVIPQQ